MRARLYRSIVLTVSLSILAIGSAEAADPVSIHPTGSEIVVTLEGRRIAAEDAGAWPCHDFAYPVIRCFKTPQRMFAAVEAELATARVRSVAAAVSIGHVIAFDQFFYGGPNPKVLSTDEPWLFVIGWNDVTSSFKSFGATGRWRENSPGGGFVYNYAAATQVAVLNNTYNNRFSAFEID